MRGEKPVRAALHCLFRLSSRRPVASLIALKLLVARFISDAGIPTKPGSLGSPPREPLQHVE